MSTNALFQKSWTILTQLTQNNIFHTKNKFSNSKRDSEFGLIYPVQQTFFLSSSSDSSVCDDFTLALLVRVIDAAEAADLDVPVAGVSSIGPRVSRPRRRLVSSSKIGGGGGGSSSSPYMGPTSWGNMPEWGGGHPSFTPIIMLGGLVINGQEVISHMGRTNKRNHIWVQPQWQIKLKNRYS